MGDVEKRKNYIVEVMFRDGTVQKWRTGKMNTGEIAWSHQNKCYYFRNDKGGETHIDANHVVTISIYEDERKDIEIGRPTVGEVATLHESEIILNKDQISFYC